MGHLSVVVMIPTRTDTMAKEVEAIRSVSSSKYNNLGINLEPRVSSAGCRVSSGGVA